MKKFFKPPFEHMLQGLAYWLAYKEEIAVCKITEGEVVSEAAQILKLHLPSDYKVEKEVLYRKVASCNKRADLGILNSTGDYECLIEFKLAKSTNGGFKVDVEKLDVIKKNNPDVECFVIIVYNNWCTQSVPRGMVNEKGQSSKRSIPISLKNKQSRNIRVRRICNAICSKNAKKMKKVVCLELV